MPKDKRIQAPLFTEPEEDIALFMTDEIENAISEAMESGSEALVEMPPLMGAHKKAWASGESTTDINNKIIAEATRKGSPAIVADKYKDWTISRALKYLDREMDKIDVPEGKNAKSVMHTLGIMKMRLVNLDDEQAVYEKCLEYFSFCVEQDRKPSVNGISLSLGLSREKWHSIVNGSDRALKNPRVRDVILLFNSSLATLWEEWMNEGEIPLISGIFLGKNHHGYEDKREQTVVVENMLGKETPRDKIDMEIDDMIAVEEIE